MVIDLFRWMDVVWHLDVIAKTYVGLTDAYIPQRGKSFDECLFFIHRLEFRFSYFWPTTVFSPFSFFSNTQTKKNDYSEL